MGAPKAEKNPDIHFQTMLKIAPYFLLLNEALIKRMEEMQLENFLGAQELREVNKKLTEATQEIAKQDNHQKLLTKKLEKFIETKNQFFANVSQELRNPLTLILGLLESFLSDHTLVSHQYNLKVMERNARTLLKLINDLMDVAKLEVGTVSLHYVAVDLARLTRQIVGLFESYATERKINFLVDIPSILRMEVDVDKIQRVIMNLLSNAFKFTPPGGTVQFILHSHNVHTIKIVIADGGPGIPPKMRDTIFDRFFYVEENSNLQFGGVSLGLAMVEDFIELHGGTITLSEGSKGGAVFTIDLPTLAPPNSIVHDLQSESIYHKDDMPSFIHKLTTPQVSVSHALRHTPAEASLPLILIVEDNIDVNQYLSGVLSDAYRIENAYDGEEGLEKAKTLHPDLILTDILMPKLDGIQLIQKIREFGDLRELPIVVLSAKIDEDLCAKLLAVGAQDYLAKPFSHGELRARVSNLINLKYTKDQLQKKNQELTMVNDELDAFSYSVSHDLRNPLQAINGFSSILIDNYQFDSEVTDYLNHILIACKRMQEIINDLLSFSHALRSEIKLEKVDLSVMAKDILTNFHDSEPNREVEVIINKNIMANCDSHLIKIVMENLLANAWKYTSKNAHPLIEFGVIQTSVPIYYVRDNGVGFPQAKADKLFVPFSRLHSEQDFPGTGIGLAIVKRIVDRHEGRIYAESEEHKGTTFYMTLEKEKRKIGENKGK